MYTTKSAFTELELSIMNNTKSSFEKFINYITTRAGTTINVKMVDRIDDGIFTKYVFTGSTSSIYMLGYEWALWQFPPNK